MKSNLRIIEKNTCVNPLFLALRLGRKKTDLDRLRFFVFKKLWTGCTIKLGFLRLLTLLFRPLVVAALSIKYAILFTPAIKKKCGMNAEHFFFRMYWICLTRSVTPMYYCRHQLYLGAHNECDKYLFGNESYILLPQLNDDPRSQIVDDKEQFYAVCAEKNIPIPTLFTVIGADGPMPNFPQEDIVVKPVRGSKGAGIEIWTFQKGKYIAPDGRALNADDLFWLLRKRVKQNGNRLLLQRRLFNHSTFSGWSKNDLIPVRIVTCRTADNDFFVCSEALIMGIGKGQAVAPILPDLGRLGAAVPYGVIRKEWLFHPISGVPILNRRIPFRDDAIALALRSHACFAGFFSLGWDIAITGEGPVVLEANKVWDVETAQRPARLPIAQTSFPAEALAAIDRIRRTQASKQESMP